MIMLRYPEVLEVYILVWACIYIKDANHSHFCGILLFFKADFRITISDVEIPANNDFKMVPDKIKGVIPTATPVLYDHW